MNHGLRIYQSSCRSFEEKEEEDDEIAFVPISIPDCDGLRWGTSLIKDHSRNTVCYPKSLRLQAFDGLEAFKMYYVIGMYVSSLHRESTNPLVTLNARVTVCTVRNSSSKSRPSVVFVGPGPGYRGGVQVHGAVFLGC